MIRRGMPTVSALVLALFVQSAWALEVAGASTIQPVIEQLRGEIESRIGEPVELRAGGSGAGVRAALEAGAVGMVSRALTEDEQRQLRFVTIGFDALAVIVNRDNPVTGLSRAQLVDLYSGRAENWRAVGGEDRPVVRVTKEVGRSTLDLFEGYSGMLSPDRNAADGRPRISGDSYTIGANIEALTMVGGMRGAIGYVSLGTAQSLIEAGMPVKVVALDGVMPSAQTIVQRSYPIVRELNMVYRHESPQVDGLNAVLLGRSGQEVVRTLGFLAVE